MKYAHVSRPGTPPGGVTAGIDWASADHAVCVVDAFGEVVSRFSVGHTAEGLRTLVQRLAKARACEVAIERGDGPVVDALLEAGVTVVVITPRQVKNLRSRYGSAGNNDDRFDAYVLADVLRTDRARLRPLIPDSPATVTLRQACRARQDLVRHRVAVTSQLRAHLLSAFPGMVGLFCRPGLGDQPGLPGPLRLPGPGRLAVAETIGRLAERRRLQRPHRPGRTVSAAEVGAAGRDR
jgi:transposase